MGEDQRDLKRVAGEYAVRFVDSGMVLGLGHGSTAIFALRKIGSLLASGELQDIVAVPCSTQVAEDAEALGIPLASLNDQSIIDVTIDGADEVEPSCDVIKGGGGALLREKIVAQATQREIIVVDPTKLSDRLGTQWAIPVEVVPFGWQTQVPFLRGLGADVEVRHTQSGDLFRTDQGNLILDCDFGPIADPHTLVETLGARAGIVEHGLFLGLVDDVIVGEPDGIRHMRPDGSNND